MTSRCGNVVIKIKINWIGLDVEEREKELNKRREESKKIQEKEVPDIFHHVVKRDEELKKDDVHKLKSTYVDVVKKGMERKEPLK